MYTITIPKPRFVVHLQGLSIDRLWVVLPCPWWRPGSIDQNPHACRWNHVKFTCLLVKSKYISKYSHMLAKWAWVHLISQKYVRLKQTCFRSAPDLFTKGFLRCFLRFLSFRLPLSGAPAAKAGRPAVERWWNQGPNDLLLLRLGDTTRDRIGNWFRAKKTGEKSGLVFT